MIERPYNPILDGDVYLPPLFRDLYPGVSEGPGIRIYTETRFRLTPSRQAMIVPAVTLQPMPVELFARFVELAKRPPGLSRRARRRHRGERASILKELAR
ncbi:hypothetical protein [Methylobacterium sp. V23]|uniref:hypothetical protein n=2 Tax=Methylobacteriaceae TaxID=119045 RepID=UPI0011B056B7|nr:hypothetical protein [Methylobacterium sp. V23]